MEPVDLATATVDHACEWLMGRAHRGECKFNSAKSSVSAAASLLGLLQEGETRLVVDVRKRVDVLAKRWEKEGGAAGTARTYASRVSKMLDEYVIFLRDPVGFVGTAREARQPRTWRDIPLDGRKRDFVFSLPPGGLTENDVRKIALHLATLVPGADPRFVFER